MKRGFVLFGLIFLLMFAGFVSAERLVVKGKLVNEFTGELLVNESISYSDGVDSFCENDLCYMSNATTDSDGNFELELWSESGPFFSSLIHFGEYGYSDCEMYSDFDLRVRKYTNKDGDFWTLASSNIDLGPYVLTEEEINDFGESLDLGVVYAYPLKEIKIKKDLASNFDGHFPVFNEIYFRKSSSNNWSVYDGSGNVFGSVYRVPIGYEMFFVAKRCFLLGGYYSDCQDNEINSSVYKILNDTVFFIDDEENIEAANNELLVERIHDSMELIIEDAVGKNIKITLPALDVKRKAEWGDFVSSYISYWVTSDGSLYNAIREKKEYEESFHSIFIKMGIEEALVPENLVWKSPNYEEGSSPIPLVINNIEKAFVVENNVKSSYDLLAKFNLAGSLCNEPIPKGSFEEQLKYIKETLSECDNRWEDFYLDGNNFKPDRSLFLYNLFGVKNENEGPLRLTLHVRTESHRRRVGELCGSDLDCKSGLCSSYGCVESKESFLSFLRDFFPKFFN